MIYRLFVSLAARVYLKFNPGFVKRNKDAWIDELERVLSGIPLDDSRKPQDKRKAPCPMKST